MPARDLFSSEWERREAWEAWRWGQLTDEQRAAERALENGETEPDPASVSLAGEPLDVDPLLDERTTDSYWQAAEARMNGVP